MTAALAAFYNGVKVGHVEAGLRSFDKRNPFPEEINRHMSGCLADFHFAPTERSRQNLLREGVREEDIFVTGNTIVDALLSIPLEGPFDDPELAAAFEGCSNICC
jgi:UDP-N-acetylglucosamine 2-epimerase (non-hydrolysing)